MKYILASASPRRKELLKQIGIEYDVIVSDCDESYEENLQPYDVVKELAKRKAKAVYESLTDVTEETMIIAADTVVAHNGKILGKPKDRVDAKKMLSELSGDKHTVYTGVALLNAKTGEYKAAFYEKADVFFRKLTYKEIEAYINTGEPMDKAGAYGIQGKGAILVDKIEGDYFTIVGLPLTKLYIHLNN
jgi:septum formation protein